MKFRKKGANALGIAGIVVCIVLFEALATYFTVAITNENVKNVFEQNCDCGLGGCTVYVATHSFNELYDLCESQADTNTVLQDTITRQFWNMTIIGIILFVLNLTLIIVGILVLRGVPA